MVCINLNARHVNGMTHYDFTLRSGKLAKNTYTVIRYLRVDKFRYFLTPT